MPLDSMPTPPRPHKRQEVSRGVRALMGRLAVGDRLPPVAELERHFGASTSTVVSVLADLEREGRIIRKHGAGCFVAEPPAPAVSTSRGFIALLAHSRLTGRWFHGMVEGVRDELRENRQAPLLILHDGESERFRLLEECWERGEVAGYVQVGSLLQTPPPAQIPGVVIGEVPEGVNAHQVSLDNVASGRMVAECLWDFGHRRVAYIYPEYLRVIARPRTEGMTAVWEERGMACPPVVLPVGNYAAHETHGPEIVRAALEPLLQGPEPITAVFAVNDALAAVVVRVLERLGKGVPEAVSVVGFDNTETLAALFRPSLTTVQMPETLLGRIAAQTLSEVLRDPSLPWRCRRVAGELILRDSVAPAR